MCGYVEAEKVSTREAPCRSDKIAAGAAAEFQYRGIRWRIQSSDKAVATKQVIFAGEVVDMALPAVDTIHQGGMACCWRVYRTHGAFFT
ncbi:hypothetical protein ASD64_10215 [Mesorhizobium sp. Root157]|nr:hypothetical protein ASD64_10215 [Mesorhizobium sp. Root157]